MDEQSFDPKKDYYSSTEEITSDFEDEDTCTSEELDQLFKHKYKIHDEPGVTYDDSYVLRLTKDDSFTYIAAGLSDGSVRLFEVNSEKGIYIEPIVKGHSICGIRFVDQTPNLLLVGITNGIIRLIDLRVRSEVSRFVNDPESEPRDILSFDRNSNSRLLAMGTVAIKNDVSLLFYDFRSCNQLFGYFESHQEDLTSLCFHPRNPKILCSGSTDGLINIYDLKKSSDEYDAIFTTINTDSTVHKVKWHKTKNGKDIISCLTHTNGFKAYQFNGDIIADFDRLKITANIKRKNESNCNLINCHSMADHDLMLLSGTNQNDGSILRCCKVKSNELLPYANFENNKQIVRDSIFDNKTNILITGGESGFVTLWTPLPQKSSASPSTSLKVKEEKTT